MTANEVDVVHAIVREKLKARFAGREDFSQTILKADLPRGMGMWGRAAFALVVIGTVLFWCRSSSQPLIDQYSFRQSQTAMTAQWFDFSGPGFGFTAYETPVLGAPWSVPFEFPLYQAGVAAISRLLALPLIPTGRLLSAALFLLALLPLHSITAGLKLRRRTFYIGALLLLCSPFYLYWGRTFLIESTAYFLGFVFLACVERSVGKGSWGWLVGAVIAAAGCALVKITTFPSFLGAGMIVAFWRSSNEGLPVREILLTLARLLAVGIVAVVLGKLWTDHADAVKRGSWMGEALTSHGLTSWNFGTLAQRLNPTLWRQLVWDRVLPESLGSRGIWIFFVVVLAFCRGKQFGIVAGLVALFFAPVLIFFNLHHVHSYYQFANLFWLILAFGYAFSCWSERVPWLVWVSVLVCILGIQWQRFSHSHYYASMQRSDSAALQLAPVIARETSPEDVLLVVGDDWSPELAFHSGRRAIYVPYWVGPAKFDELMDDLRHERRYLGNRKIKAVILNTDESSYWKTSYPEIIRRGIRAYIAEQPGVRMERVATYEVYWTR